MGNPERIDSAALNEWFSTSIPSARVLDALMTHGIRADSARTWENHLAKNHKHAEKLWKFGIGYPHYPSGYCRVIDNQTNYAKCH